jgi:hypothetical protein
VEYSAGFPLVGAGADPELLAAGNHFVAALGKLFDHLPVEGGDIVRLSTRDPASVSDHFLINPLCACVLQVGFNGWEGCHLTAGDSARSAEDN